MPQKNKYEGKKGFTANSIKKYRTCFYGQGSNSFFPGMGQQPFH
jgi:hypothetical protein